MREKNEPLNRFKMDVSNEDREMAEKQRHSMVGQLFGKMTESYEETRDR